ncbi:MAG TPA: alpha/beta fold hydrolase, partial [Sphingomicrobium sp.]|nr:alpha/beta fold hydrolase [Sphingomicrobium sp.]
MRLSQMLFVISALLLASSVRAAPGERQSAAGQPRISAVQESRFIPVGGIQQWLTISGSDRSNPIVVFLHGGPGNPLSPYSRSLYGGWAKDFTIVQWDQRGAGRTFEANPQSADMALTIDRMASDGIEVVEHLTRHLGQPKVLLVGGSWGSALGVHMIARRPDLFHAYVGVGQLVSESANQAASLQQLRLLAVAGNDQVTLDGITALGAPSWSNPRNFGKLRRLTRTYEAKTVEPAPAAWWVPEPAYATPSYERAYEAGEEYSYLQFV